MQGGPDIQCNMDRIIYFRLKKNKKKEDCCRVQAFRTLADDKELFYLQICGTPKETELECLQEEMDKALQRLASYQRGRKAYDTCYLMYEESFEKWLRFLHKEAEWRQLWKLPVYTEYQKSDNFDWIFKRIFSESCPKDVLILGIGTAMQEWLPLLAPKVQSMTFYLDVITRGFENFREKLYEEYGLITQVNLVEAGRLQKLKLKSEKPVLVIDLSGSRVLSAGGLKEGSIWLDMECAEGKRHSIEDRRTGTEYLSFKKLILREMQETLDTISKF